MTIDALIMFAGALVALMPFLGFPVRWDTVIFFVLGVCIVSLGIAVRRQRVRRSERLDHSQHVPFAESVPQRGTSHEIHH